MVHTYNTHGILCDHWSLSAGGGKLRGKTIQPLMAKENGYKSKATFKGLTIEPGTN